MSSKLAPHHRHLNCARLCHAPGGELERIQFLLGQSSVQTTKRYLGQRIRSTVNDRITIEPNPWHGARRIKVQISRLNRTRGFRRGPVQSNAASGLLLVDEHSELMTHRAAIILQESTRDAPGIEGFEWPDAQLSGLTRSVRQVTSVGISPVALETITCEKVELEPAQECVPQNQSRLGELALKR